MKLLFICPNLETGGAERQWSILLPLLRDRGIDIRVVTLDGRGRFFDELAASGIDVTCLDMQSRFDVRPLLRLAAAANSAPDVVVSRGVSAQVVGQLLSWRWGSAHVTTEHTPVDANEAPRPLRKDQRALVRAFGTRADAVVAVAAAQVRALVSLGYRRGRIHVISNGVDAATVHPSHPRGAVREALGAGESDVLVLMAAALRPEKRVHDFIAAVRIAHAKDARIRGILAGAGPSLAAIREQCGNDGIVRALGPRADIPDLLAAADIVCLTSSAEALPMIVIEAMAATRPIVAADVGGVRYLLADGDAGRLVKPADVAAFAATIVELAQDERQRSRLSTAAADRHRARLTAEVMTSSYIDLFQRITSRRGVAARWRSAAGVRG